MHRVLLNKIKYKRGVTLMEVVVGVSLLATVTIMSMHIMSTFIEARKEAQQKTKALYLAEEGLEIVRFIRDDSWTVLADDLSVDTRYFLATTNTYVATTTYPEIIDSSYRREFVLRDVYRSDISDDIVASTSGSAHIDDGTIEVEMRVGYGSGTTTVKTILTNIFGI